MKSNSQIRLFVLGSTDRQLADLLRDGGANIASHPLDALGSLSYASAAAPDAVVLDLRDQPAVPEVLAAVKRQHPHMGVVIVAAHLDPSRMLDAMRAGVTEWIVEPVTASALTEAIQRVLAQRSPKDAAGNIFAFIGAKGGVGTTTVAVNVATALATMPPRKALFVDLHLAHGDAAVFFGAEPRFSTADVLDNIHRLDEAFLKGLVTATRSGVHLLASSDRPVVTATEARHVRQLVEFAAEHYSHVVLDVPRPDLTMLDALDMSTSIVVVANQELPTVRRAGALALTLRQRYGKDRVNVVINRFDRNADIRREDVERVTGARVRHLIPSDYRVAVEGLNKGQPVVVENHNQLAGSFSSLAQLLAGASAKSPKAPRAGLLGRLGLAKS